MWISRIQVVCKAIHKICSAMNLCFSFSHVLWTTKTQFFDKNSELVVRMRVSGKLFCIKALYWAIMNIINWSKIIPNVIKQKKMHRDYSQSLCYVKKDEISFIKIHIVAISALKITLTTPNEMKIAKYIWQV